MPDTQRSTNDKYQPGVLFDQGTAYVDIEVQADTRILGVVHELEPAQPVWVEPARDACIAVSLDGSSYVLPGTYGKVAEVIVPLQSIPADRVVSQEGGCLTVSLRGASVSISLDNVVPTPGSDAERVAKIVVTSVEIEHGDPVSAKVAVVVERSSHYTAVEERVQEVEAWNSQSLSALWHSMESPVSVLV
jgi:hypothetical protein